MRPLSTLLHAAVAGASILLVMGQGAQAAPDTGREGVFPIGIPTADISEPEPAETVLPPGPAEGDVQSVWALGAEGRWHEAAARLRVLRGRHQGWQAPADILAYVANGQREHEVREAQAARDWGRVLKLLPVPAAKACERPFDLWARADALEGLGINSGLRDFYERVLTHCDNPELLAALASRASGVLDREGISSLVRIPSLANNEHPEIARAYAELVRAETWLNFQAAQSAGDIEMAGTIAGASEDVRILAQAGWIHLEPDPGQAAGFFRSALARGADEDVRRGLVMAALATGDYTGARSAISEARSAEGFDGLLARADLDEARMLRQQGSSLRAAELADRSAKLDPALAGEAQLIGGGALLDAAAKAYDLGDLETAGTLARKAAAYPAVQRAAQMRSGWVDLQSGDAELAAATFSRLYLAGPDDESAEGFALAAQKAGKLESAAAIARAAGGPLGEKVQAQYASVAFYQGDYLTARALAPDTYEALEGVNHTLYRQSVSMRQQDGARGENRMTGYASTTSMEAVRGVSRYEAGVTLYKIDTGANGGAGRETLAAPYLGWSQEGETSLATRIGLMPVGAGADPAISGEVAATRRFGAHMGEARVFVRPRTDSLLAFAGADIGSAGQSGRVVEAGALVRGRIDVGGGRTVQADISAAHLDGRATVSNSMVSAGLSASQAIARDGFDYLVTGPFYQFQSYDRNTNFFSAGHGGYFSPQRFHRAGWSVNARTNSLRDWIVKVDGAVAFESVREDAAPQIGGGKSSGVAGSVDVAMARRLGREVIVSANLSATASKAFEDLRAGLGLVWVPGGRAALVPSDLATDPFSPGSWIRP